MTKIIIGLLIILGLWYAGRQVFREAEKKTVPVDSSAPAKVVTGDQSLPGMPSNFEPALEAAQKQGPAALKAFITRYRSFMADPRLAAIELDYVVLVSRQDLPEAKRVFQSVKSRTPANSPIYERVKRLSNTYE